MVTSVGHWVLTHPALSTASVTGSLMLIYWRTSMRQSNEKMPPGPWGLPFLGSRLSLDFRQIHKSFMDLRHKYGEVITVYVFSSPFVILNSYSAIKEGFSTERNLMAGRPPADEFLAVMNEEVFMTDFSDHWKLAKKTGVVSVKKFAGPNSALPDVIMKEVYYLLAQFGEAGKTPVDPLQIFQKVVGNTMSSFIYGVHYEDHDDPELDVLVKAVLDWYDILNMNSPWDQFYPEWLLNIMFKKEKRQFAETCKFLRDYTLKKMSEREPVYDPQNPTCFLEYYLATRDMDAMGGREGFADTIALYTVDPLDGLSVMLQWSMLYLAYYPEEQTQLQSITDKVVGLGNLVELEHRNDLCAIEAFLHEMHRHCNFTCMTFGHAVTKDDATFRGYHIPRHTPIYANFYAVHMDPEVHPNPEVFKADRFLEKDGTFRKGDKVMTFGLGARSCPGDISTRLQLFLMVANILHAFSITFPENNLKPRLEMQPKSFFKKPHPFKVVFTKRF